MFGIGMPEFIVILLVALVVLGPRKLPEIAKAIGKGLFEFKKAMNSIGVEGKAEKPADHDSAAQLTSAPRSPSDAELEG